MMILILQRRARELSAKREQQVRYRRKYPGRASASHKKWRDKNLDAERLRAKTWYEENPGYHAIRNKRLRREDPQFKIKDNLRRRIRAALKENIKSARTLELLGCATEDFKTHLERRFAPGMSWENYGRGPGRRWEIDHIRPCASFDLTDPAQQRVCFHFSNQQPLWAVDNRAKSDKVLASSRATA